MTKAAKKRPAPKRATKAAGGRPTKYSAELGKALCKLVETYGFIAPCARAMGVTRQAVYEWRDRSEAGDATYGDFAVQLRMAQGKWEQRTLRKVKDPRWLLERADPETYGRAEPGTVVNVTQTQTGLTRAEALRELKELAQSDPEVAALLAGKGGG